MKRLLLTEKQFEVLKHIMEVTYETVSEVGSNDDLLDDNENEIKEILDDISKYKEDNSELELLTERLYNKYNWVPGIKCDHEQFTANRIVENVTDQLSDSAGGLAEDIYNAEYPDKELPDSDEDEDFYENDIEWQACLNVAWEMIRSEI